MKDRFYLFKYLLLEIIVVFIVAGALSHASAKTAECSSTDCAESTAEEEYKTLAQYYRRFANSHGEKFQALQAETVEQLQRRDSSDREAFARLNNRWQGLEDLAAGLENACSQTRFDFEKCACSQIPSWSQLVHDLSYEHKLKQILVPILSPAEVNAGLRDYGGFIMLDTLSYPSAASLKSDTAKLHGSASVPLLIGIDGEGGAVQRLSWVRLPNLRSLQAANPDPAAFQSEVEKQALLLQDLGFNWNLSPIVDVTPDHNSWIYSRVISPDANEAGDIAASYIDYFSALGVYTTAKHFPGHGATNLDSHFTIPRVHKSKEEWVAYDKLPFAKAIEADVEFVMTGHLLYSNVDPEPASLSAYWIEQVLRQEMGFKGLVVTDDLAMLRPANNNICKQNIIQAVNAGNDLIMVQHYYNCDLNRIVQELVAEQSIDITTLEQRYRQVLTFKKNEFCN